MAKMTIDGTEIEVEDGITVLQACEQAGVFTEMRRREHYEKPTTTRKRKAAAARKRELKRMSRQRNRFQRPH